jgi:hypothetical protein
MGILVDVSVSSRWSLTYQGHDNLAFVSPYFGNTQPAQFPGLKTMQLNMPEGRFGVAYHFQQLHTPNRVSQLLLDTQAGGRPFKNSIGVAYTSLNWSPLQQYGYGNQLIGSYAGQQWLGAALEYRYMPRSWGGVQLEGGYSPQSQSYTTSISGGQVLQTDVCALLGHRWGKIGIYGEGGVGAFRTRVLSGATLQGLPIRAWRDYPDVLTGGMVDISLSRRLSASFTARDNLLFIGPFSFVGPMTGNSGVQTYGPFPPSKPFTDNLLEIRAGFAFHF